MQSVFQNSQNKKEQVQEIISEIQENIYQFEWFLSSERLIEILSLKKEDYYRILYKLKSSDFNPTSLRGFSQSEGKYLCLFLENLLGLENLEFEFFKAGILFLEHREIEVIKTFKDILNSTLENHRLDRELLLLLASSTKSFEDAFESYLDDKFDWDVLVERVVNVFLNLYNADPYYGLDEFLKKFLKDKLQNKKINLKRITNEYKERYYFDLFGENLKQNRATRYSKEIIELLAFFGLRAEADKKELKNRYLQMLKKYHPDLNKNGLEKTKIIIQNYNRLKKLLHD